ncbi:MAG TPA: sulfide/dihydroorotate dehydrogenase-like FAD/NAD-binding protein [Proteiniclasticum sp.]|nr:sulfide/dihydroorotate dehydrogenase-like FAD/NAD-binding protein [Proteiniclasticum sp.]
MYKIIRKKELVENIYLMDIEAKRVAKSALPGQFVIVKVDEWGERIPLTICDYDREEGTVTIVFQTLGASTKKLAVLHEGDEIRDFVGPLGNPSEVVTDEKEHLEKKRIVFVAGGVGTAPVYPQVKMLKEKGIDVDVIIGTRSKSTLIMEEQFRSVAKNLYICTDDGSYGFKGLVTEKLKELIEVEKKDYNLCIAIGPMIMMKFVSRLTKSYDLETIVSLNPIMVDGTGMCGACRVTVGNEIKFACVDGPEFNGHLINFDEAMRRQTMYKTAEGKNNILLEQKEVHVHSDLCDLGEILHEEK